MKRHLFLGLALAGALALAAEDYESLIFNLSDGSAIVLPAQGLRMEVKDAALQATAADGSSAAIPLADLASFRFSSDLSLVLPAEAIPAGADGFEAYTLSGLSLGRYSSAAQLPAGTYIIVSEGHTSKIAVK